MKVRLSGAWKDVPTAQVRVGGQWKRLSVVRAYISGAWTDIAVFTPPLTATASPTLVSRTIVGPGTAVTPSTTVTPAGGESPYTYAWTRLSGVGTITSPTSATTTFSHTLGIGDDVSGDFRCTVTDAFGTTATASVTATFTSLDPGGA